MADDYGVGGEGYVDSLRRRLTVLEQKVIGEEPQREYRSLTETLDSISRRLQTLGSKKEEVQEAWKKIEELESVLKPEYANSIKLSVAAKEELLLCYSEQLDRLEVEVGQLQALKDTVNSSAFRGMESQEKQISSLARTHVIQEEEVAKLSKQVREFVDTYSKLLLQVSSQCVQWDEILTQLEKGRQ